MRVLLSLILVVSLLGAAAAAEDPALHGAWETTFVDWDPETDIELEVGVEFAFHPGGGLDWNTTFDLAELLWVVFVGGFLGSLEEVPPGDPFEDTSRLPPLVMDIEATGTYDIVEGAIHADVTEVDLFLLGRPAAEGIREYTLSLIPWVAEQLEISEADYPAFEAEVLAQMEATPVTEEDMGGFTEDLLGPTVLADSYVVDGGTLTLQFEADDEELRLGFYREKDPLLLARAHPETAVVPSTWGRLKGTVR